MATPAPFRTIRHLATVFALAVVFMGAGGTAAAQTAPPSIAPAPLTRPSVPILPGAPQPLVSIPLTQPTPLATPVPIPTATATSEARAFNCSCYSPGSHTQWAGSVNASSYVAARQAATGACLAAVTRGPQSPLIQRGQSPGLATGQTGAEPPGTAGTGQPAGGTSGASSASALKNSISGQTLCNVCACN